MGSSGDGGPAHPFITPAEDSKEASIPERLNCVRPEHCFSAHGATLHPTREGKRALGCRRGMPETGIWESGPALPSSPPWHGSSHELHITLVHACFLQPVCSPRTSDPRLQEYIDIQLGQTQCGLQMPRSPDWASVTIFVSKRSLADCLHLIHPWTIETSLDVLTACSKAGRLPLFSQSQATQVTPLRSEARDTECILRAKSLLQNADRWPPGRECKQPRETVFQVSPRHRPKQGDRQGSLQLCSAEHAPD